MKSGGMMFENMPNIMFDQEESGWKSIFLGILSPYGNKYQKYIEAAVKRAKDEQKDLNTVEHHMKTEEDKSLDNLK
jgi:hypothetical protein